MTLKASLTRTVNVIIFLTGTVDRDQIMCEPWSGHGCHFKVYSGIASQSRGVSFQSAWGA